MKIKTLIALISGCLAFQAAHADIQSQEPRAVGMGGTGTAVANSAQAHFYNPSLLASPKENEDFNFELQGTLRIADPKNLRDSMITFAENGYFAQFATTFAQMSADINANDPTNLLTQAQSLIDSTIGIQTDTNNLSGKSLSLNANAGAMTSVPTGQIGWAAYANVWADAGASFKLSEADNLILTTFINDMQNIIDGTPPSGVPNDPTTQLTSSLLFDAVVVKEFGISLASPYTLNNYTFDVGITPKYMAIQAYGFQQTLEQSENESGEIDLAESKDYSSFNVDIGLSKQLNEYWKSGLVIKNLIPQSFKTPSASGNKIEITPAVRVGTSYQYHWATVAADLDLTKNAAPASGLESQYLALGAELDVWLAKIRLGYRANLAEANNNTVSAGLGLYLFGLNIDAAAAVGEGQSGPNDANAAIQIGLQW